MGEPLFGRTSGKRGIPFALPIIEANVVTSVVFASLDLAQAAKDLKAIALPAGGRIAVVDRRGKMVMEHPPRQGAAEDRKLVA